MWPNLCHLRMKHSLRHCGNTSNFDTYVKWSSIPKVARVTPCHLVKNWKPAHTTRCSKENALACFCFHTSRRFRGRELSQEASTATTAVRNDVLILSTLMKVVWVAGIASNNEHERVHYLAPVISWFLHQNTLPGILCATSLGVTRRGYLLSYLRDPVCV